MPMAKSAATSIPVTEYNLVKRKFDIVPYPTVRPQAEENPSIYNSNAPQPETIPNAPTFQVRKDTPWPSTMPASINLFEARADWPIPPTPAPTVKVENTEVPPQIAVITNAMVLPKQIGRKMYVGTTLPHLQEGRRGQHRRLEW